MNVVRPNDVSDPDEVAVHVVAVAVFWRCGVGFVQAENTFFDEDHEKSGFEVLLVVAKLVLNNHRPHDACTSSLTTLDHHCIDRSENRRTKIIFQLSQRQTQHDRQRIRRNCSLVPYCDSTRARLGRTVDARRSLSSQLEHRAG